MNPMAPGHIGPPDFEFDGHAWTSDDQKLLCRIALWLPWDVATHGRLEVELLQQKWNVLRTRSITSFRSHDDFTSLTFQAFDPLIRRARFNRALRRTGGINLTIPFVRNWSLTRQLPAPVGSSAFEATLSQVNYGFPVESTTPGRYGFKVDYPEEGQKLDILDEHGNPMSLWQLQRHWHWRHLDDSHVFGCASPVLKLIDQHVDMSADQLDQTAHDICTLLSLAARHRIHVYRTVHEHDDCIEEQWLAPLQRPGAATEEGACGPLIHATELGAFIQAVSQNWNKLDCDKKHAVRLAIFAIHPSVAQPMELRFLNLFASLEGLAKRWIGPKKKKDIFSRWFQRFRDQHPIELWSILWPVCETGTLDLYGLRNEFAHGRGSMQLPPGTLPIAVDQLQLQVEFTLLALLRYQRKNKSDWLTAEQIRNQESNARLRAAKR